MQQAVVRNMNASLSVPVFRASYTITTDALDALYKQIKSKGVTMTGLLSKAVAATLVKHPIINASYTDAGRVTYYAYELKNVQVVSSTISGAVQSDDVPVEEITLNFEEIKVTYTENDRAGKKKGNIEYTWKVEEAEK